MPDASLRAARSPGWSPTPDEYAALRRIASAKIRHERPGHTLDPTALVHEALLRMSFSPGGASGDQLSSVIRAMRNILVDYARRRRSEKRGGSRTRIELDDRVELSGRSTVDAEVLLEAIEELEKVHPRQASVVQFRFFADLRTEEIAERLGVAPRTVKSDWAFAQAWLRRALSADAPASSQASEGAP
ncbi:MAG TPA: ECF-type sigma factor [Phycisphaerales bacterium]|nr:ECF-type sigma factor [Phycisphaerales bacterium]HMP37949.1 ECF-type sigma factor [Phycisphaerales bacterium]